MSTGRDTDGKLLVAIVMNMLASWCSASGIAINLRATKTEEALTDITDLNLFPFNFRGSVFLRISKKGTYPYRRLCYIYS